MLTAMLFVLLIGLAGWHWALVGLVGVVFFQLYPIRATIIFIVFVALFILGKRLRKKLTRYLKRYF